MDDPVDTKPLKDYAIPTKEEPHCIIVHPLIAANNFELKPYLIGMVQQNQFVDLSSENPNLHLSIFVDNCGTVKANDVDKNDIRLHLFSFCLRDHAWAWLQFSPANSITSWAQLKAVFLAWYFLPRKMAQVRNEINNFRQEDGESLLSRWENTQAHCKLEIQQSRHWILFIVRER